MGLCGQLAEVDREPSTQTNPARERIDVHICLDTAPEISLYKISSILIKHSKTAMFLLAEGVFPGRVCAISISIRQSP